MRLAKTFLLIAAMAGAALQARDASACGGCFVSETEVTQVTGHKMILSISQAATTLYDQITYDGNPSSFAWILPIKGVATVGLSSDALFQTLVNDTQVTIVAPPLNCNFGGCNSPSAGFAGGGEGGASTTTATGGVTVIAQQTVGPYQTVQLQSTDPTALTNWLSTNGYNIPADIQPIIAAYVNESFDFLALKLVPGQGVSSMRPVRVTTSGATPTLPLRMVAAGTGAITPINLWILGEGRYETTNLPNFQITADQLTWDWDTQESNYDSLKAAGFASTNNTGWLVDYAQQFSMYNVVDQLQYSVMYDPANSGYADASGNNALQNFNDDMAALFGDIPPQSVWLTRLEGQLSRAALTADLQVGASADQSYIQSYYYLTKSIGTPPACPVNNCGTGAGSSGNPSPGFGTFGNGGGPVAQGGTCAMGHGGDDGTILGSLGAVAALALARRRRWRR
jgi:hypothetical protein